MNELSVTHTANFVPVATDDEGRPYCPCGCGELMVEESPGRWICETRRAMRDFLAAKLGGAAP